jgi:microsomal dipeptidase-like Zn-dependent dipeptidase
MTLACLAAVASFASMVSAEAAGAKSPTRYSVAGGCWSLEPAHGQSPAAASQLRLKATRLGSYMLFTKTGGFLAASGNAVAPAAQPSPAADWRVRGTGRHLFTFSPKSAPDSVLASSAGNLSLVPRSGAGPSARFRFAKASGCAVFPEAQLNVKGKPAKGKTPYGQVRGVLDGHMHWMTFEYLGGNFHCGRPWSRYGIPSALPDCSSIEGPEGSAAPVQNFLNYGNPVSPHDTTGWPKLTEWSHSNLTYEGTYYRWIQRDWKAGLRMIVMPVNENRELCQLMTNRRNSCDEMTTVRKGIKDIKHLQSYVDAQAGGPGKGFFRIVRNPFQARRVINQGKMAVVLEVEVSELFGCKGSDPSSCSRDTVDQGLDDLHKQGVRSSLLLNKFDNPLTGVRFDGGPVGALINAANRDSYGSFWSAETCQGSKHDNTIESGSPQASSFLQTLLTQLGVPSGSLPTYPPAPHCNTRGLTGLGAHTVRRMMNMGMIVNPDHMSQRAVDETLSLAEARSYSGVISPHGWMDPGNWPRIWQLGGLAFPGAGTAQSFVDAWKAYRPKRTPYYFGWGYGADLGGLATQGSPPAAGQPHVKYPFKSIDGHTTVSRQKTGDRTFDYSNEGVAHYGLYADWYNEVQKTGGRRMKRDMLRGPEAYLQMWERSVGVPASRCQSSHARFTARGLGRLRLGSKARSQLMRAGQPLRRTQAWSYCVKGKRNRKAVASAVMTPRGRVALVATSERGHRVRGIGPGASVKRLRRHADPIGGGVWTASLGGHTLAFVVRHGVVHTVALAGGPAGRSDASLRTYLRLVPRKGLPHRPSQVITSASSKVSPAGAVPLAAQHGASPFPYFCGL